MEAVKGLVIFTKPWEMVDERTGEKREGLTVEYLMAENLNPVVGEDGSKGVRHCKETIGTDKALNVKDVPGWYNLEFGLKPGSKGKMEVRLQDIHFVGPVDAVKR